MCKTPRSTFSPIISKSRYSPRPCLHNQDFYSFRAKRSIFFLILLAVLTNTPAIGAEAEEVPKSSGTGFVVSRQGHILTNYHVITSCPSVRIMTDGGSEEVPVIAVDEKNDLALLKLSQPMRNVARFRKGRSIRSGDGIVVVGFPYHQILASEANVTIGVVSALAGLRNDSRFIQISAPVQPGNSGGPVLDSSGHVVGVVESKLNALAMALITGDIPQNVNFAIKDSTAKSFLDSRGIAYETMASEKLLDPGEIGEIAKRFTHLIECYSETIDAKKKRIEKEHRAMIESKRKLEETRERIRLLEREERNRVAREKDAERRAREQEELQRKQELAANEAAEMDAASKRVIRFHSEEREIELAEEAQHKGREALSQAAMRQEESVRTAALAARDRALHAGEPVLEEARRRGHSILGWSPNRDEGKRQLEFALAEVRPFQTPPAAKVVESSKTNSFWARIQTLIVNNWVPPSHTESDNAARAIFRFRYYRNGTVKDVTLVAGSRDSIFDHSALLAIMARSPLPSFPESMTEPFKDVEMVFKNEARPAMKGASPKSEIQLMVSDGTLSGSSEATPLIIFNNAHRALMEHRDVEAALGFQRIVRRYFSNALVPEAHYWLGESYFRQKDFIGASQQFRIVLREYPDSSRASDASIKLGLMGE